jgi:uncharacterized protein
VLIFWLILGFLLFLNALWAWHADSSLRRSGHSWKARIWPPLFALAMATLLTLFVLARGMEFPLRDFLPRLLVTAIYLWHLIVLPVWLLVAPVAELTRVITSRIRRRNTAEEKSPAAPMDRRLFLRTMAATVPPTALFGLTALSLPQLNHFRVRRLEIPLPGLPPALDGLTLAHISDTHVGVFTAGPTLSEIVRVTNKLRADLVLMTGDLINDDLADLPEAIAMVKSLDSKYGVFLCEGNHDLIPGPTEFSRKCKAAGLDLLVNEQRSLDIRGLPLQVLGLRWGSGDPLASRGRDYSEEAIRGSMNELMKLRDPDSFPLLLAHHPHAFDVAAEAGLPLTLAGHTHGGQLMVNENLGFGPALYRYWSGLYRIGESVAAISNGTGNWFPLRTAAPAEILHLTLRRAPV